MAIFHRDGRPVETSSLEAMLTACPERAVDGHDTWSQGAIALAHQHFWVTPEEQGELQPLVTDGGGLVITCDARLDNREELAKRLEIDPSELRAMSDADLLLRAYRRWGEDCPTYLQGDFAFAVWDAGKNRLFLACDPLGMRSLGYYLDAQRCVAGSEIRAVLAHPDVPRRMNEARVAEYLVIAWDNAPETIYEQIFYLPAAHCLSVGPDEARLWRYWQLDPHERLRYRRDEEYSEHYLALLVDCVRDRMRTSGKIGITMSGGLDSTSMAAVANRLLPQAAPAQERLLSFSYTFDELQSCDEREYIRPVVDDLGLEAHYLPCDGCWTLRDLPSWPVEPDFILSDPFALLPEQVMQAAGQAGVRVLLSGYFGDALFTGGYFWALDALREGRLGQLAAELYHRPSWMLIREDFFQYGLRELIPYRLKQAFRRVRPRAAEAVNPGMEPGWAARVRLDERIRGYDERSIYPAPGQYARLRSLLQPSWWQGLGAARRFYHRRGVELEQPYRDRRLIEFVMSLPADQLGRPIRDRWVHSNAMVGLLPEKVRERTRRTNFNALMQKGIALEWETVCSLLNPAQAQVVARGWAKPGWLAEQLESILDEERMGMLWLWSCVELWLRRFWA